MTFSLGRQLNVMGASYLILLLSNHRGGSGGGGGAEEKAHNQQLLSGLSKAHHHNCYISIVINQLLQWNYNAKQIVLGVSCVS